MKRVNGGWERITWDQALTEIANKLLKLREEFGPSVLGMFSGSIGVENLEMVGLTQRFKAAFGSPNFFSVESICYRMRIRTRQITFGKYPTEELDSNLYILWGHNPDESDFPLQLAIEENLKKGAKLVVIDPKRIPLADRAEMYLRIRPGTDGAMALAMINVIINEKLYDADFIEKYTLDLISWSPIYRNILRSGQRRSPGSPPKRSGSLPASLQRQRERASIRGRIPRIKPPMALRTVASSPFFRSSRGTSTIRGGWVISPRLTLGQCGDGG